MSIVRTSPRIPYFSNVADCNVGDGTMLVRLVTPNGGLFTQIYLDLFWSIKEYMSAIDWLQGTGGITISSTGGVGPVAGELRALLSLSGTAAVLYPAGTVFSTAGT